MKKENEQNKNDQIYINEENKEEDIKKIDNSVEEKINKILVTKNKSKKYTSMIIKFL